MTLTQLVKKKVAASQQWKCKACFKLLDECFEIDHVVCKKDGGTDNVSNLQAMCPNCHRRKTNRDVQRRPTKAKTSLPSWWDDYAKLVQPQTIHQVHFSSLLTTQSGPGPITNGHHVRNMIRNEFPHLIWDREKANLSKLSVNELKITIASIRGEMKHGSKKELLQFLDEEKSLHEEWEKQLSSRRTSFTSFP